MSRLLSLVSRVVGVVIWPSEQQRGLEALGRAVVLQQRQIDALEARVAEFDVSGEAVGDARGA